MSGKFYTLVICIFLVFSVANAVAGSQGEGAEGEKMTITWMSRWEDPWAMQEASRLFNVNIVSNGVYVNDRERREIMIAAEEWPDCGPAVLGPLDGYRQGVHRSLPISMLREYAPNYAKLMDTFPVGWLVNQNPDDKDEVLAINGVSYTTQANLWYPQTRIDYIRNVGMDLPGYDENKSALDEVGEVYFLDVDVTIDWIGDLLRAYKEGDPDGNGVIGDVTPMGASSDPNRTFQPLMGAFGVGYRGNRTVDGEFVTYHIDPGLKDFLVTMAEWYADDLIDKEFPTHRHQKHWAKIETGQQLFACEILTYSGQPWAQNRPPNTWVNDEDRDTGAEAVLFWPPVGPKGDQGSARYGQIPVRYNWVIYNQVDDAKAAKILEVINWRASDEGFVAYQMGKEGVHFDFVGERYNSFMLKRSEDDVPEGYPKNGEISVYPPFYAAHRTPLIQPAILAGWYEKFAFSDKGLEVGTRPERYNLFGSDELREANEMYGETLDTMFTELFFQGITGQIDVAAEWDNYVAKWLQAGGKQLIAATEKLPLMKPLDEGKVEY